MECHFETKKKELLIYLWKWAFLKFNCIRYKEKQALKIFAFAYFTFSTNLPKFLAQNSLQLWSMRQSVCFFYGKHLRSIVDTISINPIRNISQMSLNCFNWTKTPTHLQLFFHFKVKLKMKICFRNKKCIIRFWLSYEKHTERVELLLRIGACLRATHDGFINMAQYMHNAHWGNK